MGRRLALLIATYEYQDAGLRRLTAPAHDAQALAAVLEDPQVAGFEVTVLVNEPHHRVGEAVGDFYRDRRRDDLTLLYFTGHGLKDDDGRLYLAMANTRRDSLLFTGLSAEAVDQAMESCLSQQKLLILDCCYSGAYPTGRLAKADAAVHTLERFQGRGRTVLTASDSTQYAFEGDQPHGEAARSVFTRYLVEGLRDGSADLDGDGDITVDELYTYVHDRVVAEMPQQRPKKQDNVQGRTVVARNVNWTLPSYLRHAVNSPLAADRLAALDGLDHLHRVGNELVRAQVRAELARLADDDSKAVSAAASARLRSLDPETGAPGPARPAPPESTPPVPLDPRPAGLPPRDTPGSPAASAPAAPVSVPPSPPVPAVEPPPDPAEETPRQAAAPGQAAVPDEDETEALKRETQAVSPVDEPPATPGDTDPAPSPTATTIPAGAAVATSPDPCSEIQLRVDEEVRKVADQPARLAHTTSTATPRADTDPIRRRTVDSVPPPSARRRGKSKFIYFTKGETPSLAGRITSLLLAIISLFIAVMCLFPVFTSGPWGDIWLGTFSSIGFGFLSFLFGSKVSGRKLRFTRKGIVTLTAAAATVAVITTLVLVLPAGRSDYTSTAGPAPALPLRGAFGVAVGADGTVYIADDTHHQVWKVDASGRISTIAGTGTGGFSGDGGPATDAQLAGPHGVAVGTDGTVYIADTNDGRVRKVDASGRISTIAGTGTGGFSGDGGPATDAQLAAPWGVAVGADGTVYIADAGNHRVRKVDASGRISTIAGTGTGFSSGFSGDGGPATDAQLDSPNGVAVGTDGTVYIADTDNHRVRKVDASGRISTIAGTGTEGFSGDGGPATDAQLDYPYGVAVGADGTVYIADIFNNRVRKIDTSGKISTIAGTGTEGFSGDGGPATDAQLFQPHGVAVGADGTVYIGDTSNERVRKVDTSGRISAIGL